MTHVVLSSLLALASIRPTLGAQAQQAVFDVTEVTPNVCSFHWETHRNLLVGTDDGVLVADPLNPRAAREIQKRTSAPLRYVLYRHEHWDHILGGRPFKEEGDFRSSDGECMTVLRVPLEKLLFVVDLANPRTLGYRMLAERDPLNVERGWAYFHMGW